MENRSKILKLEAKHLKTKHSIRYISLFFASLIVQAALETGASAQGESQLGGVTYADLAGLADPAEIVLRAEIRKQAEVEPERSPGLSPGHIRLYIEARTEALISGSVPVGESLRYLVDVPLDQRGKVPKLKKESVLLFARTVPGRPGDIQLVAPSAQLLWSPDLEARLRPILTELAAPDSPPQIAGVRDALSIEGNLVGESETQIFLSTETGQPVSISVIRRPGQAPVWGVSWSDIIDQAALPPEPDTLDWYRLACFLPDMLPESALIAGAPASKARTRTDYRFVRAQLGACPRMLS